MDWPRTNGDWLLFWLVVFPLGALIAPIALPILIVAAIPVVFVWGAWEMLKKTSKP